MRPPDDLGFSQRADHATRTLLPDENRGGRVRWDRGTDRRQSARKAFCPRFCHAQEPMRTWFGHGSNVHTTCYNRSMRLHDYAPRPAHLKWLLDSDLAIRWQVMRDLTGEAPDAIPSHRSPLPTNPSGPKPLPFHSPA